MLSKSVFSTLVICLIMSCVLICLPAVKSAENKSSLPEKPTLNKCGALLFRQTHNFFGDTILIVAQDAVRMENKARLGFTLVARAPVWRVYVFRTDEKTIVALSLKQFEASGLVNDLLVKTQKRHIEGSRSTFDFFGKKLVRVIGGSSHLDFLPIKSVTTRNVERVVYAAYKCATCGGIPIRLTKSPGKRTWIGFTEDQRRTFLDTKSLASVTVPSSFFDPPKGFRPAESMIAVVSGNKAKSQDQSLMDLLEAGERKPR